jgi:hypothetical protein
LENKKDFKSKAKNTNNRSQITNPKFQKTSTKLQINFKIPGPKYQTKQNSK